MILPISWLPFQVSKIAAHQRQEIVTQGLDPGETLALRYKAIPLGNFPLFDIIQAVAEAPDNNFPLRPGDPGIVLGFLGEERNDADYAPILMDDRSAGIASLDERIDLHQLGANRDNLAGT